MLMNPTEGSSGQEIDVIYKTKHANILGRYVLFLLQNDAGPCALLAICNVLLLQNMLNLHPDTTEIASSKLLYLLEKRIHDIKRSIDVEGLQQNISEAFELLPCLATGLNADVCLKKFCDLLDIRLVHEGDIQESLDVPSHSHQHLRIGDIQEEFELELAMRLSEDKNPPTKDESTMQIPSKTGKEDLIKKPENALSSAQNSHGCLQEGLCVSYRNNHFNTMFEHGGEFYLLVTDQRCLNRSRLVWEKLNVGNISRQVETWTTSSDQELARVLQQLEYTEDEASGLEGTLTYSEDLEFAIFLQQLEFTEDKILIGFLKILKEQNKKQPFIHLLSNKANMNEETEHFTIVASLKDCGKEKSIHKGYALHADLLKRGLFDKSHYVASALISMYSKCGLLVEAHEILKELLFANIVCWNALISGYSQMGPCKQALRCLERMHSESISPNVVTFTCILKACATIGDIKKGKLIHGHIADHNRREDLSDTDIVLGIALVDMYVKCGSLLDAQRAHDELCARNFSSWSLLISGYVQDRQGHQALKWYQQMQHEGIYAESGPFFVCVLKACGTIGDINKGKQIHVEIVSRIGLLEKDIVLCNALVDMYIKCGVTAKAREILEEIPIRNVVSWNALIGGYAQQRQVQEALDCYKRMRIEGILADIVTMIGILKACGRLGAIGKGKQIHQEIISRGLLEKDIVLGNALVDMYAKCGALTKAQEVVDTLPFRDIFSWNTLIYGYCKHGQGHEALICFDRLQSEGLHPDEVSFTCILKACGIVGAINKGKCIHDEIVSKGLLKRNDIFGTALIDMYVKCGDLATAAQVLEDLPVRNVVCWSSLISGYVDQAEDQHALNCFESMQSEGLSPDVVAFTCILKACGNIRAIDKGKQIHKEIASKGWLSKDSVIGNALVNMYVKCDELRKAHEVLEEINVRDHVSWNTLINGFIQHEQDHKAMNCFEQMQNEGLSPNVVTFICILQACGNLGAIDKGKSIHSEIVNRDWLDKYIVLGNALLDMYAKCGMLTKAQEVFEDLRGRNIASWNAIITAFSQEPEQGRKAVNYFERLQSQLGLCPDSVTFICTLRACGNIGAIDKGIEIHNEIISKGLLEKDNVLGNALVDMYAKCGMLAKAIEVMEELSVRDRVGWNALIGGYAQQGQGHEALKCFEKMQRDRVSPDEITLLSLLSACSHSGLLDDAQVIYANMTQKHNLIQNMEHQTCMVVALGYAGHFDKAMLIIQSMSSYDYLLIWLALLGSCEKWGNVELGKLAFDQTIQLDHNCAPAYALMASIFASANMQHDAQRAEVMRLKYAAGKEYTRFLIEEEKI